MAEYIESELLKGLAKNDTRCAEKIYRENYKLIQALVINNNGNVEDAKDIFQEAMLVLYQKSQLADFSLTCQIQTYLYSVSRRLWLKKLQAQYKNIELRDNKDWVDTESDVEVFQKKETQLNKLQKALEMLGEPCKGLIESFYIESKSMQEIAELFKYTNKENAKNQKYKCMNRLKNFFFNHLGEETDE